MTPRWERIHLPPTPPGRLYMDATLTPHRSLSRKAFARVIGAFALINSLISIVFILNGAYPVVAFLAVDVGLLWMAFRMNYAAARLTERVRVAPAFVHVSRSPPKGGDDHWVMSPLWARVSAGDDAVRIGSAVEAIAVGAFLSPEERESFSQALKAAISEANRGGRP